jgi:outer membrane lipase/esterase
MTLQWMKTLCGIATSGTAAVLLASCGGGTQIESFKPVRVIAFGDEASYIHTDGRKFTVNNLIFDTTVTPAVPKVPAELDCVGNQVWVQQVAYSYGLAFAGRCPGTFNANGVMMAADGAKAADVSAQVTSFLAGDTFSGRDLVTFMVGINDIKDAVENAADPLAVVEAAGTRAGEEVVRITDRGAKVLVSTVPDLGHSPWAINRETTVPGTVALASQLSARFNTRLRLKLQDVRDGGHAVGLVLGDEITLSMWRFPTSFGIANTTQRFCAPMPAITACDVTTRNTGVAATSYGFEYLWADDYRLGPNAHYHIGAAAASRARTNPF